MISRNILFCIAVSFLSIGPAMARPGDWPPAGSDPQGYYSDYDHRGYYERDGHYRYFQNRRDDDDDEGDYGPPPNYCREGDYEQRCRSGNATAGTIFGALAGGLIGGAASHGNGGAVVGGLVLGGLLGNVIARDIPCEDHSYAFRAYSNGLNGPLNERYNWRNDQNGDYGAFRATREYRRGNSVCREFHEVSYHGGQKYERSGTACRRPDGDWMFDN